MVLTDIWLGSINNQQYTKFDKALRQIQGKQCLPYNRPHFNLKVTHSFELPEIVTWSKEMMHGEAWQEILLQTSMSGEYDWPTIITEDNRDTLNAMFIDKSTEDLQMFCLGDSQAKSSMVQLILVDFIFLLSLF